MQSIIIVGAGLGGLAVATALARRGARVTVYEQSQRLGEVGAGIQLSPNAMKALRAIGLDQVVEQVGFEPEYALMRHYATGRRYLNAPIKAQCRARYGAPYIHIHRADLHAALHKAAVAAGVVIELGQTITGYEETEARVAALLGDQVSAPADLLIGADGIRSVIRDQMLGPERPVFTGQTAWRGVIPAERLPKGLIEPSATVWVGPDRHLVTYYLRGGALINFVAVEERSQWQTEGWSEPGNLADLRAAFDGWHSDVTTLLDAVDETFLWTLFGRDELPKWFDGRAVLLGDACHPTLPFMAQGAAMALEDAVVLARLLAASETLPLALARYEATRKPRTTYLQAMARHNADLFHLKGGFGGAINRIKLNVSSLLRGRAAIRPLDKVYGYDPTAF